MEKINIENKQIRKKKEREIMEKRTSDRLAFFRIFSSFLFVCLIFHLMCLQIFDVGSYKKRGYAIRNTTNFKLRGNILDRNGLKLAVDKTVYTIYAHPSVYSKKRSIKELANMLYPYMDMNKQELIKKLSENQKIIFLKKDVDKETAYKIKKLGLREISIEPINKRFYPQGNIASHVIGYYSSLSGHSIGVEHIADKKLSNYNDIKTYERARNGDIIFNLSTNVEDIMKNPKGEDLTLTIDTAIQHVCEKELNKVIKEKKAQRGAIIVMDVRNGEILAYANYPSFDPNNFNKYSQKSMKNWSLTDVYPPGSTFKIITVAIAMELGAINEFSKINDTGKMKLGNFTITNHDYREKPNPGNISLEYLFTHSSNVASAKIALMLDKYKYYDKLRDFGFGKKTGIDLTAESSGILEKPIFWGKSRQASMGYGYGASVNAIQVISAVSAIANDGVLVTPHIIKYSEKEEMKKIQRKQVISSENAKKITKLLTKSVENSNSPLKIENYSVAGKTGTSRKTNENASGWSNNLYASTVGYFPSISPRIAIYVVVDLPKTSTNWGSTIAAPVFKAVAVETIKILNLSPNVVEAFKLNKSIQKEKLREASLINVSF